MNASVIDPATWTEFGIIDPDLEKLIQNDPNPLFAKDTSIANIVATRNSWIPLYKAAADRTLAATDGTVLREEIWIPRRDGNTMRALLYKPAGHSTSKQAIESKPLLVLVHGGGFCFGSPEMEGPNCIRAVQAYNCVALSLSYRLAPEHQFPSATDDCWDALQWISKNASSLGADLAKAFILGGTSAGGNIAAVLSHLARDASLSPPLTGLYLNVPLLLAPEAVPDRYKPLYRSREQNALAPVLNKAFMDMYTEAYAPNDFKSYIWSPLNWPSGHRGLPPTYFQICGLDVLRDEGLIYERILREEHGIPTKIDVYSGLPHMFVPNYPRHPVSKKYPEDTLQGIGWLLGMYNKKKDH